MYKQKIQNKIRRGEIMLGDKVVVSTYSCYKINLENSIIKIKGIKIRDICRFFHGDGPATQFN